MMIQSDAVKALVSLAEDNNVLVSKAKAKKVLVRLREQDEDMSIDDAYPTLSNAFLADHTLFADHEQLSASGSVLNETVARLDRDDRDAELREHLGKDRASVVDDARAEWDTAHPAGFMAPNDSNRLGRNES